MRNPLRCNGYHYTSRTPKVIAAVVLGIGLLAGWLLWSMGGARPEDLAVSLLSGVALTSLPGLLFGAGLVALMKREPCTRCAPAEHEGWIDER